MEKKNRIIVVVLSLVLALASFALVGCSGCNSKKQTGIAAPDDLAYKFNSEHSEVTLEAPGENVEYSKDGKNWQDSGVFAVSAEELLVLSARYKEQKKQEASAAIVKKIYNIPDVNKFDIVPTEGGYGGSITVDLKGNTNIYEFKVGTEDWDSKTVWEVEKSRTTVRARIADDGEVDGCETVSVTVDDIPLNQDTDSVQKVNCPHTVPYGELSQNTAAEGIYKRGDDAHNNRSVVLTLNPQDKVEVAFTLHDTEAETIEGYRIDIKIVLQGYDGSPVTVVDDSDRSNPVFLSILEVNEWKSIVIPSAGYAAFSLPECTNATGAFKMYIDNIEVLDEDEAEALNQNSKLLFVNGDAANHATALNPQIAVTPVTSGKNIIVSSPVGAYILKFGPVDIPGAGLTVASWRAGVAFNFESIDLTDYDGISFYVFAPFADGENPGFKEDTYTMYTKAGITDDTSYNNETTGCRWNLNSAVAVCTLEPKNIDNMRFTRIKVTKETLTAAGYDITALTHFNLLGFDTLDTNRSKNMGRIFLMDFEYYRDAAPDGTDKLSQNAPADIGYVISGSQITLSSTTANVEYSLDGEAWQDSGVFTFEAPANGLCTVYARAKADATHKASAPLAKELNFDDDDIALISSMSGTPLNSGAVAPTKEANTQAEGLYVRTGIPDNRSVKIKLGKFGFQYTIDFNLPEGKTGFVADFKVACTGYDTRAIAVRNSDWIFHAVLEANQWKSVQASTNSLSFCVYDCADANADTLCLYIDNITFLTAAEVNAYDTRSNLLIANGDMTKVTALNPQNATTPGYNNSVTVTKSSGVINLATGQANGWRLGIKVDLNEEMDLTEYDGISFYMWVDGFTGTYTMYTKFGVVDNTTYDNLVPRFKDQGTILHTVLGVYDSANKVGDRYVKITVPKATLTAAGYDIEHFTYFNILGSETPDSGSTTPGKMPDMKLMDFEAYKA